MKIVRAGYLLGGGVEDYRIVPEEAVCARGSQSAQAAIKYALRHGDVSMVDSSVDVKHGLRCCAVLCCVVLCCACVLMQRPSKEEEVS